MEEEKRHAMFASFRAGRSPKDVIEFFNTQVDPQRPWKAWNSFKKNGCSSQKAFSVPGATRTDEFVTEVKRTVTIPYANLAAEMVAPSRPSPTINKDLATVSYKRGTG
ncbi:Hypothetical protein FKW44_010328 [Caligus rogercresseyi]|uniref:Uncharacterized protein n=1 Tax=Caligus rogercresseyi TaxID=217165 RepID=A0A7T8K7A1_CALRO|nr:Hypothetical protein FKW44_010328 [Caligus rogercresseyi]